jgi:hypothetical protein
VPSLPAVAASAAVGRQQVEAHLRWNGAAAAWKVPEAVPADEFVLAELMEVSSC